MPEFHTMSVSEAIAQFLKSKNVQYAFGIGGHGNTPTLAAIRPLHENGDITVLGLQHETVATHAATALKLVYGIESIVFTSIGPGYENTIIGQSTASNNGVGFLIFAGDRNLSYSSRNMQQILNEGQFGLSELGKSAGRGRYVVTTPDMIQQMLPAAWARAHRTGRQGPVNIMMPMDMQSPKYDYNLDILLRKEAPYNAAVRPDTQQVQQAVEMISRHNRIVMRIGGGARKAGESIIRFSEKTGAQIILSPNCDAVVSDYPANRNIAGSKGSIIGNFAAETATLVIDVAGRGVCQSTCSGTLYQNRREFMKINVDEEDALREGGVLAVVGDAVECLEAITKELVNREYTSTPDPDWLTQLETKEQEWQDYLQQRRNNPVIDGKLTQPAVIMAVDDFINSS